MSSIEDKTKSIIAEELGLSKDEIDIDASFTDDLGADSLDIMQLVMDLEEEYDMQISDEEASDLVTVQRVIDYIKENK